MKPLAIVSLHASPLAPLGSGENGGMNVYIRSVCIELSRRGIPTEVFTRRSDPLTPPRMRLHDRSWVTQIAAGEPSPVDKGSLFDLLPAFTEGVLREVERTGDAYGLVHSHYWLSGWTASRLQDEWQVPWFHTAHTLARVKNERAATGAVTEPDHRIAVEQGVVRDCDRLIASSVAEADDLVRLYGAERSRVAVVPPGVDLKIFKPRPTGGLRRRLGIGESTRVIVFAGRLERLKGAETVLRALAILAAQATAGPDLALVIIGDDSQNGRMESVTAGGERVRLESLAEELGIRSRVRFLGAIDQKMLAAYLSLAEVCVVPSYSESFGLVALEAQACGTPVVAARVGGLPVIVKDGLTGFTLSSHDPAQYAERIGRLLQDPELRRCFSRRSRLVATQFTWEATVDRLLSEYAQPARELQPAVAG
ncbi:MAG TPA: glycosyltransferase [Candidatus Limnocylindrales bacterium]|nr:glycosyltransferase [Candidatus Limnocylindrales bacterium]